MEPENLHGFCSCRRQKSSAGWKPLGSRSKKSSNARPIPKSSTRATGPTFSLASRQNAIKRQSTQTPDNSVRSREKLQPEKRRALENTAAPRA